MVDNGIGDDRLHDSTAIEVECPAEADLGDAGVCPRPRASEHLSSAVSKHSTSKILSVLLQASELLCCARYWGNHEGLDGNN